MPTKYCPKGHKNLYDAGQTVNFCSSCGSSMETISAAQVPAPKVFKRVVPPVIEDDDDEGEQELSEGSFDNVAPFNIEIGEWRRPERIDVAQAIRGGGGDLSFSRDTPKLNKKQIKLKSQEIRSKANARTNLEVGE